MLRVVHLVGIHLCVCGVCNFFFLLSSIFRGDFVGKTAGGSSKCSPIGTHLFGVVHLCCVFFINLLSLLFVAVGTESDDDDGDDEGNQ